MANEKRLIDANELTDRLNHITMVAYPHLFPGLLAAIEVVDDSPTVDAVEVVHGEWEITEDDYFDLVEMKCSVCGESYGFEDYEDDTPQNYHYCPNCGAKMDGDGNG